MPYMPEIRPPAGAETMPVALAIFAADRAGIERQYDNPWSPERRARLRSVLDAWQVWLDDLPRDALDGADALDAALFDRLIETERERMSRDEARRAEMRPLAPFADDLVRLLDERRSLTDAAPDAVAQRLHSALDSLRCAAREIRTLMDGADLDARPRATVANRTANMLKELRQPLEDWRKFRAGYDPLFTWWVAQPFDALAKALDEHEAFLRKTVAGAEDADAIIGDPVGRDALTADLEAALIPYTPDELIGIGEREAEWCRAEMRRASGDMGLGDDWRAALERVKQDHVPPGGQAKLVGDLAQEAIAYLEEHDLMTVPELARDGWKVEMMSPERQKVNPFFLGGESIVVSYPTDGMEHDRKLMSMRGNNRHFSRATVQHELIPGHYMQHFCQERYRPYRQVFYTPFWTEGWTLYWELRLWELGFPRTPEERMGMLFWRMHRAVRIVFSLKFHLGRMSAAECVAMLTDEVGHERATAEGEVRRSFGGDYPPLYQCAYMIGGLQMLALHREMVRERGWTERRFHDAVMRENCMPIAMLRAALRGDRIERDARPEWRFAG
jgi:uncharacterized protein (DUF885 family)